MNMNTEETRYRYPRDREEGVNSALITSCAVYRAFQILQLISPEAKEDIEKPFHGSWHELAEGNTRVALLYLDRAIEVLKRAPINA